MDDFEKEVWALRPRLKNWAMKLYRNIDDTDDAVSETVTRALEHRSQFTPGTNLIAWCLTILFNAFRAARRNGRHLRVVFTDDPNYAMAAVAPDNPERQLIVDQALRDVCRLPEHQFGAVVLAGIGVTQAEGARMLGIPTGTFKTRVKRGRDHLKQMELI